MELISLDPDEARARLVERRECHLLIYCVGAPSASAIFADIQSLHTLRRDAALVIVSDDENSATVIAAIRSGARGYFSNSMPPDLALQALSFVLHGGTYFPPTAIMTGHALGAAPPIETGHHDFSRGQQPLPDLARQTRAPANGIRHAPEFTERQYAVLTCLCQGDPNKVIGRKLGMTETTVKVHVREIMRKLGVCNRTQVAIAAGRNRTISDGVVEIIPLDSAATVKSSASH